MKILICTGIYPPDIGGPATYSKLLKDELPGRGFEVEVLSFGDVIKFPKVIRHFIYFLGVLIKSLGADVIYAQDPVSVGLPSVLAAKLFNKKFLLKVVGDYAWEQLQIQSFNSRFITLEVFQSGEYSFITELRRSVERWVADKADRIVVPSDYLRAIVEQWGVDKSKISVIYNSLEGEGIGSVPKKENIIFSAGRLVPWKGFELLIEVMNELPVDLKLFIAGSGPKESDLKLKIKDLKLEDRVILLGSLDQSQMRHYFGLAKAFVLNTSYEGLSHIILEAMQNSVPVITTNVGGNPELITDGFNGLLVEYNNKNELKGAILKLLNDIALQNKFIENSHNELKKFSKEKMINGISEVLLSL
jgi:glycosyltransferase involved in cell wall biosynthesis